MGIAVSDIEIANVAATAYDLALFACGYESRCVHAPQKLDSVRIGTAVVLGFDKGKEDPVRVENDKYFELEWIGKRGATYMYADSDDDVAVYQSLRGLTSGRPIRILIDYSSMSRVWYAAVLNWARFRASGSIVEIDFVYSPGIYGEPESSVSIDKLRIVRGCEGGTTRLGPCVIVLGLGFYGLTTQFLLDQFQPDLVYAYYASPGAATSYPEKILKDNAELIAASSLTLALPLGSVETTARYLEELVTPHRATSEITLIPMGPKPHVLAAILVGMRLREVACLRVSTHRKRAEKVSATGMLVATRVVVSSQ
jgi:hypothetical protein